MNNMSQWRVLLGLAIGCGGSATAMATANQDWYADSYAYRQEALLRAQQLAQEKGFDEAYLQSLLLATKSDQTVLEKMRRPAEKTKAWAQYRPIFLDKKRIDGGVEFWQQHAETLARAEGAYGVDSAVIVAIIGVETRYGHVMGSTPVFAALSTLCFDYPERADFFCAQWEAFLRLAAQQNLNPLSVEGSYAGAMGMAQFMPSSYLEDAIDFNEDGVVDLWHSADDAIGSIANYLAKRGWLRNGKIAEQLDEAPSVPHFGDSHKPYFPLASLQNADGVTNTSSAQSSVTVGSLILEGSEGQEWWVTYPNFYTITRYNTSPLYAMAVMQLAQQIQINRKRQHDE